MMDVTSSPRSPCDRGDGPMSPCSPTYYGIYVGSPDPDLEARRHVYSDKQEALKIAKKCKSSRFKVFCSFEEAENFALNGPEPICVPLTPVTAEKSSPFKAPISQELVKFRKCIEKGDLVSVVSTVERNPRYLVSSGDTPSILQEGCRYNAMHVAAKFDRAKICEYILQCITSPEFVQRLYGEEEIKDTVKQRCDILLDLYLNTPDKAANETPLHFASKIGALDIIKILVSYDKCDKTRRNKHDQTALDVLALRKSDVTKEEREEIIRLLSSDYYIAVLRPLDPIRPPVLDGPFLMQSLSSPNLKSLLDSEMRMSGVAGPMKYEEAVNFKKLWKRPRGSPLTSPGSPCSPPPLVFSPSSFKKPDKVIERIGRELCYELGVHWIEYWPFLSDFANFQKEKGINLLEQYFASKCGQLSEYSTKKLDDSLDGLFQDFKKLAIESNSGSKSVDTLTSHPSVNFDNNLSYTHIDKTCQVYANKLCGSLLFPNVTCFINSLNKCQELINSCATDKRYYLIEFNRIHSKLASLVGKTIVRDYGISLPSYIEFLNNVICSEGSILSPSVLCLCKKIAQALENNRGKETMDSIISNEDVIKSEWLALTPCDCSSEIKQRSFKKKLDFRSRHTMNRSNELSNGSFSSNEKKTICDDYDSDSSYKTPPSSPRLAYRNQANDSICSNGEDISSEDEMFSADEGVPITIEGETLTDIDKTVFEALDTNKVLPSKHPFTYQWMYSCRRKFQSSLATPLILSPLSPAYLKKCDDIKLSLREHLLNNSPVSSK